MSRQNPYLQPSQAYYNPHLQQPTPPHGQAPYQSQSQSQPQGQGQGQGAAGLQFYSSAPTGPEFFSADSMGSMGGMNSMGTMGSMGNMAQDGSAGGAGGGYGGNIVVQGPWWTAFGPGGVEGEPPLLEELGVNFGHIRAKSMTVLNPLRRVDEHIMDDADMAGPIIFCFSFATFLLLSGKSQFGFIYGVGLLGSVSMYFLLNAMGQNTIDAYRVTSVLGYCLLPMVAVSAISVLITLDGAIGYFLSTLSIIWCTYAASGIFVTVLRMQDQRLLVAYPVGLLYGTFALLSVFNVYGVTSR